MFKRLSIFTVILSGILLVGCSNQQASSPQTSTKTEQTKKSSTKAPKKSTKSATSVADDTQKTNTNSDTENDSSTSKGTDNQSSTSNQASTNSQNGNNTNDNTANNNQSSQDQTTQSQQTSNVSLTTSDQAVEYLADQLASTYDKSTTQYVANGKVTWNNVTGYQINIYSKNSDSPVGSYLVPANGQYFQIW